LGRAGNDVAPFGGTLNAALKLSLFPRRSCR